MAQKATRLSRELELLMKDPPPGISVWPPKQMDHITAEIVGPEDTPYADGVFRVTIDVPDRYPFEPPKVKFETPIYHPNIDSAGRICLDTLKPPPRGSWTPSLNISTTLQTIRVLLSDPNPNDPLMADIANEFTSNHTEFLKRARQWTHRHATSAEPQETDASGDGAAEQTNCTHEETTKDEQNNDEEQKSIDLTAGKKSATTEGKGGERMLVAVSDAEERPKSADSYSPTHDAPQPKKRKFGRRSTLTERKRHHAN